MRVVALRPVLLVPAVVALILLFGSGSQPTEATGFDVFAPFSHCTVPFDPDTSVFSPATGCNYTPAVSYDSTTFFNIGAPDANFAAVVTFTSIAYDLKGGASMDVGAIVGQLKSSPRLGLLNTACNQPIPGGVNFTLQNASLDNSSANLISPNAAGTTNRFLPLRQDANNNGLPDGVDKFPDYTNAASDPDYINAGPDGTFGTVDDINGPAAPIVPHVRYIGSRNVAGESIVLEAVQYKPGTLKAWNAWQPYAASQGISTNPHPFTHVPSYYGWPSVTVLVTPHPFDLAASPSSITDFCSPLSVGTTAFGTVRDNACTPSTNVGNLTLCPLDAQCNGDPVLEGKCPELPTLTSPGTTPDEGDATPGNVRIIAPAANTGILGSNTHRYIAHAESQRDADEDGYENGLDPCQNSADATWNPRTSLAQGSDIDGDGIPNGCDTNPAGGTANDDDGDGFDNRQDNCSVDENGSQDNPLLSGLVDFNRDAELLLGFPLDGGSRGDGIGDVCDPDDVVSNGHYHALMRVFYVCIDDGSGDPGGAADSTPASSPASPVSGDLRATWCTDVLATTSLENKALHLDAYVHEERTGTADAASATSVTENSPNNAPFRAGFLVGHDLCMTSGAASGQCRAITTNGGQVITVGTAFSPAPAALDTYKVTGFAKPIGLATSSPPQPCTDGVDNDGAGGSDAADSKCAGTADTDGDGFSDNVELAIGTDPLYRCSQTVAGSAGIHDAWPPDIYTISGARLVNFLDLNAVITANALFKSPGQTGYDIRFDLFQPGVIINFIDLNALIPVLFAGCSPYAGP